VAADYADLLRDDLATNAWDRSVLGLFCDLVQSGPAGDVADLGCGPGRITAYLSSRGLSVFGVDLSPAMVDVARRDHPNLRFEVGSITALDGLLDRGLVGAVAWYSIIHTPPEHLAGVFAEFARILAPGGYLLLAFQVGDEHVHREAAYGHAISLDSWRLPPDAVADQLGEFGLDVIATMVRKPVANEKAQQAYLVARSRQDRP
jgi:SAM-dependent methyltransferase